ncbi:tRNA lysidine(34) synthetase TilS [Guyparkeria halopsychrophila]|uniref:tRNA lysidine(34) synthetase TilS n=1 Tax=Guyparkeria halopsychrophila TaxID=3139421 RepID=UPI0037CC80EC
MSTPNANRSTPTGPDGIPRSASPSSASHVLLASSGGRDSLGALARLAQWRDQGCFARLSVVHIDHGLHPDALDWGEIAGEQARAHGCPFDVRRVTVRRASVGAGRGSTEAAAREARYRALDAALTEAASDDPEHPPVLVTAHHADDQAETILLALMRGSGGRGLSGMSARRSRGAFAHWRPFLETPREELEAVARASGLGWVDDPANDDPGFARNHLRHHVLPELRAFWPDAVGRMRTSAQRLTMEQGLLGELAAIDADQSLDGPTLDWSKATALPPHRQCNLLRQWLARLGCLPPPPERLGEWLAQLRTAAADRQPLLEWPGGQLRRYRDQIHWLPVLPEPTRPLDWPADQPCLRLEGEREICRRPTRGGVDEGTSLRHSTDEWRLRPVGGSERLRPVEGRPSLPIKQWFQDQGIPPWERPAAIGVEVGGQLAVVLAGEHWLVDMAFRPNPDEPAWVLTEVRESRTG